MLAWYHLAIHCHRYGMTVIKPWTSGTQAKTLHNFSSVCDGEICQTPYSSLVLVVSAICADISYILIIVYSSP